VSEGSSNINIVVAFGLALTGYSCHTARIFIILITKIDDIK
jgi:hypothetical protein